MIALVVTIIVLLILAGISIMMLTGSNGILTRAGEAKEEVIVGQEKESVELAYVSAAVKKLGDDVTDEELQHELDLSVGAGKTEVEGQTILDVLFKDTNHSYTVENGKVEKNGPVVNPFDPDEWEFAWVYTAEGTWSEKITDKALIPQNYKIIAKLYEGKESGVKYSLVIEGKGEIKDLVNESVIDDTYQMTGAAWQSGIGSEGALFTKLENTVKVRICDGITAIGDGAFLFGQGLKDIKIASSVTSIGASTFSFCTSLTSIKIPDSVTGIGGSAFAECTSLTSVKIPNGVTSIERETFLRCDGLVNVKISDSVTSIGYGAFQECSHLKNVEMSSSITRIDNRAFLFCLSLESIEVPDGVETIGAAAFEHCNDVTSIEIPNSVTSIGDNAFKYCSSLTEIIIHKQENSIEGAKWGAPDSTKVTWVGE